jgi:hypothetical protein
MKIVCCVCKKLIQIKDTGNPKENELVSHSYCDDCYKKETEEMLKTISGGKNALQSQRA